MFRNISAITFKVGTYCNLNCKYCFQKYAIKETSDVFHNIDSLLYFLSKPELTYSDRLEFKLTGGEPTLYYNKILEAYKILSKLERYKPIKTYFSTISNGTNIDTLLSLFDEGILEPYSCKVSWDGIYGISKSRLSKNITFNDKVLNDNIIKLGNSKYGKDVLVRIALTEDTVNDLYESFIFALDAGCRKIEYYFITDYEQYLDKSFIETLKEQLIKIYSIKTPFLWSNRETLLFSKVLSKNFFNRFITCRHLGKMLYIEQNGDISPCGFFSKDAICADCNLIIGNIYKGFYKNEIINFIKEYEKANSCYKSDTCNNFHCFECPAMSLYRYNNMREKLYQTCAIHTLEKDIFNKYNTIEADKQVNKTFSWLKDFSVNFSIPNLPYYFI